MACIAVFCGSRDGEREVFRQAARQFAAQTVRRGHRLVYGGGSTGIMGAVADTVLQEQGIITGVIPRFLATRELMHSEVADMRIVPDMHSRKELLHRLADAYVVLPGGYGTLEEFFEALTWRQLEIHRKPVGVLNCAGAFTALEQLCDQLLSDGFVTDSCRRLVRFHSDVPDLLAWLDGTIVTAPAGCDG